MKSGVAAGRHLLLGLGWMAAVGVGFCAEPPKLEQLFPAGAARGTTNTVTAVGKLEPWPVDAWVEGTGVLFRTNKDSGKFEVEVARDAAPGPRLVRFHNKDGATVLRFFVVGSGVERLEQEPNDDHKQAPLIETLPVVINGRLEKNGDVDSFPVRVEAGQWLVARVDAYRLTSPMDPLIRVVDEAGNQVAWNHDRRVLDPGIAWKAPKTGRYVVQLMGFPYPAGSSVNFAGGAAYVYRLHLTTGPCVDHSWPLSAQAGGERETELRGWNFPEGRESVKVRASVPPGPLGFAIAPGPFQLGWSNAMNQAAIPLSGDPSMTEASIRVGDVIPTLRPPCGVSGVLAQVGEEDRYQFQLKKGDAFEFVVRSGYFGFGLDSWLKIEDAAGKELVRDDDAAGWGDPRLVWTAPADGIYRAAIGNMIRRGGADQCYHLTISKPVPMTRATVADSAFAVEAGKTNEIKVLLERRQGHLQAFKLRAAGLPGSISAPAVDVTDKATEAVLKVWSTDAAEGWRGPMALELVTTNGVVQPVVHELVSTSTNNGVPGGYQELLINETPHLWFTLTPKPPPPPAEAKKAP